jgi:hypothetical protein
MPAFKKPFENPGFEAWTGTATAVTGVLADPPGRLSTMWFPVKLREALDTRAKASRSTYDRPFTWITGTFPDCPLMISVLFWFVSWADTVPHTTRNDAISNQEIDCLPLITGLLGS